MMLNAARQLVLRIIFLFFVLLTHNNRNVSTDANPDRDTTEQFQLLNRAYEVLRDPALKQAYDLFGKKGIGTSAASDVDNIARRHSRPSQKSRSSEWTYSSTSTSPQSSDDDRRKYWESRQKKAADSTASAGQETTYDWGANGPYDEKNIYDSFAAHAKQRRAGPAGSTSRNPFSSQAARQSRQSPSSRGNWGTSPVDPSVVGRGSNFNSWTPSGNKSSQNNSRGNRRPYQPGPKYQSAQPYSGNMGSVHSQPRTRPSFEDSLFIPRDGSPLTNGEAFFGRGPKFGRDVLFELEIDATTANVGGKRSINIKHMTTCSKCKGMGTHDASSTVSTCRHCGGAGHTIGVSQLLEPCKYCHGTGRTIRNPCKCCRGVGLEETTKSLDIVVPKQLKDGYTLRVPGEGDAGPNGGPAGDLYVCFKISTPKGKTAKSPNKEDSKGESTVVTSQNTIRSNETPKVKPLATEPPATNTGKTPILTATTSPTAKLPLQQPSTILEMKAPNLNNEPMKPAPADVIQEQPTRIRRRDRIGGFFGGIVNNILSK